MEEPQEFAKSLATHYHHQHHHNHDLATTRPFAPAPHSLDVTNALRESMTMDSHRVGETNNIEEAERQSRMSQRSDDSFSAYIEHPIRQSTPSKSSHVYAAKGTLEDLLIRNRSRESTHEADSIHSNGFDEAEEDFGEASWPTTADTEDHHYDEEKSSIPHGSIIIPDMEVNDDDDGDAETGGEKKRRRRTNKAEATVLASVFGQTQFPDAHTREALAQRLNMKPKAVSIWFQNRRQAMKKRASRFGGVEGVNGPTVTAASMQVTGVMPTSRSLHREARDMSTERLKRWMSLDDVALARSKQSRSIDMAAQVDFAPNSPPEVLMESKISSSAPILDFICKQRGEHQLNRIASMPSLASLMSKKQDKVKMSCSQKDLRDLLPNQASLDHPLLHRRSSASSLLAIRQTEQPIIKQGSRERCFSLQMSNEGRAAVGCPTQSAVSDSAHTALTFPNLLSKILQKHGRTQSEQMESIWKRMQSSSSASDSCFDSSDKENRNPIANFVIEDVEEDEERTLRLIAGKRAAKEMAKKEKMLSNEGRRYIEEADARVALQQRKRPSLSNTDIMIAKIDKGATNRMWSRAVSEAQIMQKSKMALTRVPSLDLTAGRDRSKDDGRPSFRSVSEMRLSKRTYPNCIFQDENVLLNPTLKARLSLQQKKRSRHSHSTSIDVQSQAKSSHPRTPFATKRPDPSTLRRYNSSHGLATPALSLLSSRLGVIASPFPLIPSSATRESSARFDGAKPISNSQESSENGSDDWLEAWAQEKTGSTPAGTKIANVLKDRTSILNVDVASKLPIAKHDDSGFFGSESGGEYEESVQMEASGRKLSKRRLVSQGSSSPSKRGVGEDRDRLAAETLLGLGSRS